MTQTRASNTVGLLMAAVLLLASWPTSARPMLPAEMRGCVRNELGIVACRATTVDLDGDGRVEGVVYDQSPDSCGTGGCTLIVVACEADGGCRAVTRRPGMRLPVRVLETRTNGWLDLGALQYGGGLAEPKAVRLSLPPVGQKSEVAEVVEMEAGEGPGRMLIAD